MTDILRTRQDAIDIRNITKFAQILLNKFISVIQTNAQEKENNINPKYED